VSAISFDLSTPSGQTEAAQRLDAGEIVALPTDTVPGLAIRADLADSAQRLAQLKGSPPGRPFSFHLPHLQALRDWTPTLPPGLPQWLENQLPQGVTALLPKDWIRLPQGVEWPWDKVGLRLPLHPDYRAVTEILGFPLFMTSINQSGHAPLFGSSLTAWLKNHKIPFAQGLENVDAESTPSSVVSFDPLPRFLRTPEWSEVPLPGLRVLILCSGNICRSPVAEHLLRDLLAKAWQVSTEQLAQLGWTIASAGTFAMNGASVSAHSYTAGQEIGLNLALHRSQHVEKALELPWDLVLGMGPNHLVGMPKEIAYDLFDLSGRPVPDPYGGELFEYRIMRDHLASAAQERVNIWSRWPQDQS